MVSAARYRDGLLFAVLTAVAPRTRTVVATRVGRDLLRDGDGFRLAYAAGDVKNGRALEYPLPPALAPFVEHYLEAERPRLLGAERHDWLWVRRSDGRGLRGHDLDSLVRYAFKARFGTAFGPHRFRHTLAHHGGGAGPLRPGPGRRRARRLRRRGRGALEPSQAGARGAGARPARRGGAAADPPPRRAALRLARMSRIGPSRHRRPSG